MCVAGGWARLVWLYPHLTVSNASQISQSSVPFFLISLSLVSTQSRTLPLPLIHTPVPISNLLDSSFSYICLLFHLFLVSNSFVFFVPVEVRWGLLTFFFCWDQSQSLTKEGLVTENESPPTQPLISRIY